MNASLDIMTEKNFKNFIEQYKSAIYIDDAIELIGKLSEHFSYFSGNIDRLYNITIEAELIINEFSKKENITIFKISKKQILNIINKSDNSNLIEKWESIMESFKNYDDNENLYLIINKY